MVSPGRLATAGSRVPDDSAVGGAKSPWIRAGLVSWKAGSGSARGPSLGADKKTGLEIYIQQNTPARTVLNSISGGYQR
jgi:hypothetical protein